MHVAVASQPLSERIVAPPFLDAPRLVQLLQGDGPLRVDLYAAGGACPSSLGPVFFALVDPAAGWRAIINLGPETSEHPLASGYHVRMKGESGGFLIRWRQAHPFDASPVSVDFYRHARAMPVGAYYGGTIGEILEGFKDIGFEAVESHHRREEDLRHGRLSPMEAGQLDYRLGPYRSL